MDVHPIVEFLIAVIIFALFAYGVSWRRGRKRGSGSTTGSTGGSFFRFVNRKVGGLFGKAVK